jgi:hypothetical protein
MQVARDITRGFAVLSDGVTPVTERHQCAKLRNRQPSALNFAPVVLRVAGLICDHDRDPFIEPPRNLAGIPPASGTAVQLRVRPLRLQPRRPAAVRCSAWLAK